MSQLAKQFYESHYQTAIYCTWCRGDMKNDEGTIIAHVGRHMRFRKVFSKPIPMENMAKKPITHYRVVERFNYVTLVECVLETGRTHQIRVHMKYIGHPLFNDDFYGGDKIVKGTVFSKYKQFVENCFAICPAACTACTNIGLHSPFHREKEMFFEAELPDDMKLLIGKWRSIRRQ